jgi:histidyl-tRNA synthetase
MARNSISTKPVKGMRDFFPEDMRIRRWLFGHWRSVGKAYGFEEYDACVLESEELYIRKAGDEITGQLYNFEDKGRRRVALRPEMTPSLARMLMAKGGSLPLPARWFSIPQCFRYERMQRGRKREHFQWNMDIVGLETGAAEVELMCAQVEFLRRVGFRVDGEKPEIRFRVSNRMVLESYLSDLDVKGEDFGTACVIIDKKDKIGAEGTVKLLVEAGIPLESAQKILELLDVRGMDALRDVVGDGNPGYAALAEVLELAEASGIRSVIEVDLSVVRGLSYYTGTVWELFDTAGDLPRAIAGGGRYDRLMESLGGKPAPMVGFGFGDVVVCLLLKERGLLPDLAAKVDELVFPMGRAQFAMANELASALRRQGSSVLVDYSERRFKHVVKLAERLGCSRMFIIGDEEMQDGAVKVRSLADRSEKRAPLSALL